MTAAASHVRRDCAARRQSFAASSSFVSVVDRPRKVFSFRGGCARVFRFRCPFAVAITHRRVVTSCDHVRLCGFRVHFRSRADGNERLRLLASHGGLVSREQQRRATGRGAAVPETVEENRPETVTPAVAHHQSAQHI